MLQVELLDRLHGEYSSHRNALKEKHPEVFEACESIHTKLSHISDKIQEIKKGDCEHATASKYGRPLQLRTYNNAHSYSSDSSKTEKGSLAPEHGSMSVDEEISIKFYKRPVLRQYFHKGMLWRASGLEEVSSFELFVDLLYVGILEIIGERVSAVPTGEHFYRYVIFMALTWKIWNDLMMLISWFETDDLISKLFILLTIIALQGISFNMLEAFSGQTWAQLIVFYMIARGLAGCYCLLQSYFIPGLRAMAVCSVLSVLVPSALWTASIFVELPGRIALICVALTLDTIGLTWTIPLQRNASTISARLAVWVDKHFQLYPAINIEHKSERTKQFVTLVIGAQVLSLSFQSATAWGWNAFFGKAIMGLIQGFTINWIYFEVDGGHIGVHAIRRHVLSSLFWLSMHLPLVIALALAGAAMSRLVVAHDCPNANIHDLSNLITDYEEHSVEHIADGLRWFYCAGLGVSILAMTGISASHVQKEALHARIKKAYRYTYRVLVGCTLIGLSAVYHLNSLQLTGITTSLILSVLVVELYGSSSSHVSFFEVKNPKATQMNYLTTRHVYGEAGGNAPRTDDMSKIAKIPTQVDTPTEATVYQADHVDRLEMQEQTSVDLDSMPDRENMLKAMYGIE